MSLENTDVLITEKKAFGYVMGVVIILIFGAFLIYRVGAPVGNIIFYSLLFLSFLFSRNLVFWSALLFIIICYPWNLFYFTPYEWFFNITPTVGVPFVMGFGIIFFIKTFPAFSNRKFFLVDHLSAYYRPIGYFIIFLLIWSIAYGHSNSSLFNILQFLPSFLLFYSIPRLFRETELVNFNRILLLFSLIHFTGTLIEIISPGSFMNRIYFGPPRDILYTEDLIRIVGGISMHLYCIFISFYYLSRKKNPFRTWYLWLIIVTSYFFILNSATRGWMIASTFFLLGYFSYYFIKIKQSYKTFAGVVILIIVLILVIPDSVKKNINAAFNRLETIESFATGDFTAGGTLARVTDRGPRVLTLFNQSPIVGFGYSKISSDYYDGHVGNHSLLLMGGVVGFAIVLVTVFSLMWVFFRYDNKYPGNGYFVSAIFLMTVMIIHSSSRAMLSFYMPADSAFLIALVFNHFNTMSSSYTQGTYQYGVSLNLNKGNGDVINSILP